MGSVRWHSITLVLHHISLHETRIGWPQQSPDLTPCNFLWGYLKDRVYRSNPENLDGLRIIRETIFILRDMIRYAVKSFYYRIDYYPETNEGHFVCICCKYYKKLSKRQSELTLKMHPKRRQNPSTFISLFLVSAKKR